MLTRRAQPSGCRWAAGVQAGGQPSGAAPLPRCQPSARGGPANAGGLFGGLQKLFSRSTVQDYNPLSTSGKSSQQVQPQQQQDQQAEFPPYQVLRRGEVYDLRLYEAHRVVEMCYERRDEGYLALGAYMDGANEGSVRFVYTQPVVMRYGPERDAKTMQWYVGSRRPATPGSREAAATSPGSPGAAAGSTPPPPLPTNPDVRLAVAGGDVVAVLKFEGYITPETAEAMRQKLTAALQQDGLQLAAEERAGLFRVAQYGPVHSLAPRLNEMMLRIQLHG